MKTDIKDILAGVVGVALGAGLWSCSAESPFESEGTGVVHLHTTVNAITTRAYKYDPEKTLQENCVIYLSRANGNENDGLIKKWQGVDNVDESIPLNTGHYVAEAWSGDSVTASYDKIFFRGVKEFDVTKNSNQNVAIECKIRNAVVSVQGVDPEVMKDDYLVTVKNSRGSLTFDNSNIAERGYFMMPNGDKELEYTISGTYRGGGSYNIEGTIDNVASAHHYILKLNCNSNPDEETEGGAFIKIEIKDENLINESVTVATRPTISGVEFDLAQQQVYLTDAELPDELAVKICAFGNGLEDIHIAVESTSALGLPAGQVNLVQASGTYKKQFTDAGVTLTSHDYKESTNVSTCFLKFSKEFLQKLECRDTEHVIAITAVDKNSLNTTANLCIALTEAAIKVADPIVVDPIDTEANPMAVLGTSATITYQLADNIEGTPGVEYRKESETEWTFAAAGATRAATQSMTLTGLSTGTTYYYRAACGDFKGEEMSFTTETAFTIPYANMETWNSFTIDGQKNCTLPGMDADEFWGNGNPGAAKASTVLTQQSSAMCHSASSSAELVSQKATVMGIGKFAAGNLFAGTYVKTDGTDGVLNFGRPYNGSHPTALKVWVNYRPKAVEVKTVADVKDYIKQGDIDKGQIYWALTTAPVEILTKAKNRKLFDPNGSEVLAYGEYTFEGDFGPDGQLQELSIPLTYNAKAQTTKPAYIVIVCSASKYGDYFIGGEKSTMYVDDFELVY